MGEVVMALKTQPQMDRSPPGGVIVAAAFEGDEIEDLGERLVSLITRQSKELERYLNSRIGSDPPETPRRYC
jgi:hypothetical protein